MKQCAAPDHPSGEPGYGGPVYGGCQQSAPRALPRGAHFVRGRFDAAKGAGQIDNHLRAGRV